MTELSNMLRWNTNFVRGLAETVLSRAKVIRSSLSPYIVTEQAPTKKAKAKKPTVRRAHKATATKSKRVPTTKQ